MATLPVGFTETQVATGLKSDGHGICARRPVVRSGTGRRVAVIKNGALLATCSFP
jgi:hypothetical protein